MGYLEHFLGDLDDSSWFFPKIHCNLFREFILKEAKNFESLTMCVTSAGFIYLFAK